MPDPLRETLEIIADYSDEPASRNMARAALGATPASLDAGPGWWHPPECIDRHDDDHNCLDEGGWIIGWRDPVTNATLVPPNK